MNFGPWLPIDSAKAAAPEDPGVLQARADELIQYPKGRSAMVMYAHCPSEETLRGFVTSPDGAADLVRAAAANAAWVRFGQTSDPEAAFERLLGQFIERFGAPPRANATPAAKVD